MEFGIAVASTTESWRVVQRAEELGFDEAWFYDTQLLNPDVFVCMALAAERTSRIRLATGVLIPSNRIAPVAANCLATLNRLAPGRVKLGVGTGFTGRRTMGLPAIKLADLREYLRVVQALLRDETVEWETEGLRRRIRFLNPDFGLINTADPIPLAISAFGPRARRLTAELGAEWLNFGGAPETAAAALDDMKTAWRDAGREASALRAVEFTLGCVLAPGEAADSARSKAQAGTLVAAMLHGLLETPELDRLLGNLPPAIASALRAYRPIYESYQPADARYLTLHRGHLMHLRPEEERFISGDLLRALAWVGTEAELRDRVRALESAGYTQIAIQVVEGHESAIEDWARMFGLAGGSRQRGAP
jgi:5,10-methylenetetrahydromethanopterin reductase